MEKLIKNNIIYLFIVVIAIIGGLYMVYVFGTSAYTNFSELSMKKDDLASKQKKLAQIIAEKQRNKQQEEVEHKSSKVIYEVLGQQFSPEASFGIMFDNMITNITNSGLRIRSIDYNYSPSGDRILENSNLGYNACELAFVTVGSYTQLQSFLKNIVKEDYLTNINEIYLEPYDKDKSILIARFKIRLYTRTV